VASVVLIISCGSRTGCSTTENTQTNIVKQFSWPPFAAAIFMMAASVQAGSHIGSCSDNSIDGVDGFDQS